MTAIPRVIAIQSWYEAVIGSLNCLFYHVDAFVYDIIAIIIIIQHRFEAAISVQMLTTNINLESS